MFRLYYRTGGTHNFKWKSTPDCDQDPVRLQRSAADVRLAGYPTVVVPIDATVPTEFAPEGMMS